MVGFVEIITLLLGLAGFGLTPNPKAATADQALHYAMPDADIVVHVDVASVVPANYKLLLGLPRQPAIKASPELLKMMQKVINEVEGARGIAKSATGIDPATDVSDGTLFVKFVAPNKDPDWVATSRGKYSPAVLDNIAKLTKQKVVKVGGGAIIELGPNDPAIGITRDNVLVAGMPKLVRDRVADTWRPPVRRANTQLAWAQEAINAKPVFAVVMSLSQVARRQIAREMGPKKNFVSDLAARHKAFAFSVYHDGVGWTWVDRNRAGMEQLATMSDGMIELMRAAHIAPRGMAKILLGALESYRGTDRRVDEVIRRKADLMKIVQTYTGDGQFKATVNRDAARFRVDVRATGKSLSDVLPAGFLMPAAGLLLFTGVKKEAVSPPAVRVQPMPPQPSRRP